MTNPPPDAPAPDTTKRWLPFAVVGALALVVLISMKDGMAGFATGTWAVDRNDVSSYLIEYWKGPKVASLGLTAMSFATDPAIEIELDGDGTYEVRWSVEPTAVVGKVISSRWEAHEEGTWSILDQDLTTGRIQFTPSSWDLAEPADTTLRDQFLKQARAPSGLREFEWRTVNTNTLEWTPPGRSGSTITIRRK